MDIAVIIGSLVGGALAGLLPLIFGKKRDKAVLGIIGFVVCLICGFILGLLLALPVAVIFTVIIIVTSKKNDTPPSINNDQDNSNE